MKTENLNIRKVTARGLCYSLYVGRENIRVDLPKTLFAEKPHSGDAFRLEQNEIEGRLVTSIFINDEQIA